jgi:RHH-type transcriptional regulator, proline utilization regulon repressor / proline dehydrogenase / delta 1-pyrroline-5-carboxylate dehydrogenase
VTLVTAFPAKRVQTTEAFELQADRIASEVRCSYVQKTSAIVTIESRDIESYIETKAREIFARMEGRSPRLFSKRSLTGQLMNWSMNREQLKVQLFRLIDVLPALDAPADVARHARDYLGALDGDLSWPMRTGLSLGQHTPTLFSIAARLGVRQMADNFIVARDGKSAIPKLEKMRRRRLAFTADILGETVLSENEADQYQHRYLELIRDLCDAAAKWETIEQIDAASASNLPKVNVSVKISALYSQIKPAAPEDAIDQLAKRLRPILQLAKQRDAFINFDMEHYAVKDVTLTLFKRMLEHSEFAGSHNFGIAMQAYLKDTARDVQDLISWARERDQRVTVRLVKGAYWDTETLMAKQRGWPVPVFAQKHETDANYEAIAALMLHHPEQITCAFGTHNVRTIASCIAHAEALGLPPATYEFQMLYGMAEPIKSALIDMGRRVREYCPLGEILPGMSYLVRRLLENTSNEGFLRATYGDAIPVDILLRNPREVHETSAQTWPETPFKNEPHTDFTRAEARARMTDALATMRAQLGRRYPLLIGEREVLTKETSESINPAHPAEVIGIMSEAGIAETDSAIAEAKSAFKEWNACTAEDRAQIIARAGDLIAAARFNFTALEVYEVGKTWAEADADVAEAIDFCRYYAAEMRRLAANTSYPTPGELNLHEYKGRGIAAIIAPWNFPVAILCGMTAAALVAGNCAIMKPAEQSAVAGAWLAKIFRQAGVPAGAVQLLTGRGEIVGAHLVDHPDISIIAFTGSREVGLKIWETAGRTKPNQRELKKVICEMGGKNAIIVDSDADLDETVPQILASAFGYQGQKCSAASRIIALQPIYERLIARLIEAASSLQIGPPENPANSIGPVIDTDSLTRIRHYIEEAKSYAKLAYSAPVEIPEGHYSGPAIFRDVPPDSPLAQEEIFGPVLAIIPARDLDEALTIANNTQFALTGGFFSRSPRNIERVQREFEVGNLYINRGTTGALVARHPFGGHRMSGAGTKAGGPDYLLNLLIPRAISVNLMRRGFVGPDPAPKSSPAES